MNNIYSKGSIFLSGGGSEVQTRELDKIFSVFIDGKKMMYIPVALDEDIVGMNACYDWICRTFQEFDYHVDIPVIDMFLDPELIKKNIDNYDAVYIGGGDTYKLLDFIYKNNIDDYLKSFLYNGNTLYGGSAGAIILGKDIRTVLEEKTDGYSRCDGLNLLNDYSIRCHYTDKDKDIILDRNQKFGLKTIALPEESGLFIKDHNVIGVGEYHVYE